MKKLVGLYKFMVIENPIMVSINVNLQEYFEKYRNKFLNKKHKRVRKGLSGMACEEFASSILLLKKSKDAEQVR